MNFVQHDQLAVVIREVLIRVGKPSSIRNGFEVQVDRATLAGDFQCERRFPNLSRSEQAHGGVVVEQLSQAILEAPLYHPCNLKS